MSYFSYCCECCLSLFQNWKDNWLPEFVPLVLSGVMLSCSLQPLISAIYSLLTQRKPWKPLLEPRRELTHSLLHSITSCRINFALHRSCAPISSSRSDLRICALPRAVAPEWSLASLWTARLHWSRHQSPPSLDFSIHLLKTFADSNGGDSRSSWDWSYKSRFHSAVSETSSRH